MAADVDTYAAKQRQVADTASRVFTQWLADNPTARDIDVKERLVRIAMTFGDAAAELAVEYYMQQRGLVAGLAGWEAQAYVDDPAAFLQSTLQEHQERAQSIRAMQEALGYVVQQAGRRTITRNAKADPAGPRWARVPVGKTCAWCLMLSSRGAVYFTKESAGATGRGTNRYHGDCDCQPTPVWPGQKPPYDAEALYDLYAESARRAGGSSTSAITAQMRRDYPDMLSDGVTPET